MRSAFFRGVGSTTRFQALDSGFQSLAEYSDSLSFINRISDSTSITVLPDHELSKNLPNSGLIRIT